MFRVLTVSLIGVAVIYLWDLEACVSVAGTDAARRAPLLSMANHNLPSPNHILVVFLHIYNFFRYILAAR